MDQGQTRKGIFNQNIHPPLCFIHLWFSFKNDIRLCMPFLIHVNTKDFQADIVTTNMMTFNHNCSLLTAFVLWFLVWMCLLLWLMRSYERQSNVQRAPFQTSKLKVIKCWQQHLRGTFTSTNAASGNVCNLQGTGYEYHVHRYIVSLAYCLWWHGTPRLPGKGFVSNCDGSD